MSVAHVYSSNVNFTIQYLKKLVSYPVKFSHVIVDTSVLDML